MLNIKLYDELLKIKFISKSSENLFTYFQANKNTFICFKMCELDTY